MVELTGDGRTDARLDFLDRLKAKTDERRAAVEAARRAVRTLSGEATSPDRLVSVKVNPQGALLELTFDDDVSDLAPAALAALVLETARTATDKVTAAMREAVAPLAQPLDLELTPPGDEPESESDPTAR